ncbi:MAG: biopolymer transporter ExbD [Candidatus Binatia bacterium]|nr:biopolymer transporter ExbD [Candidatus Binatia bacterium]
MRGKPVRGHYAAVEPEINVTPLVDVVLVLLIIFMVVVPQMQQQRPVEPPQVVNADPEQKQALEPWSVTVVRSGEVFVDDAPVDAESLKDVLSNLRQSDPNRRLVIRADSALAWAEVRAVLAGVQQAGYPGASLLVHQRKAVDHDGSRG